MSVALISSALVELRYMQIDHTCPSHYKMWISYFSKLSGNDNMPNAIINTVKEELYTFKVYFYYVYMYERCACKRSWLCEPFVGIGSLRCGPKGSCLPTKFQFWEPHGGSVEDHQVLLTTEPSLKPLNSHFAHSVAELPCYVSSNQMGDSQ